MRGASLLENWILEGEKQDNFPVNAFFFCPSFLAQFFLEQSYE